MMLVLYSFLTNMARYSLMLIATALFLGVVKCEKEIDLDTKVYKGTPATASQYPYMVSLQYTTAESGSKTGKHCGGSLIAPQWVLTAAHCFQDAPDTTSMFINAGITDAYDYTEGVSQRSTYVKYVHTKYNAKTDANDIALLRLDTPMKLKKNVSPIALPPPGYVASGDGLVMGWGATTTENTKQSRHLLSAEITVLPLPKCRSLEYDVTESQICVGTKRLQPAPCQGDSGGPFVQTVDGKPTIVGVLSYADETCAELPSVYTNVSAYLTFISDTMKAHK